jgi:hypothetical protein
MLIETHCSKPLVRSPHIRWYVCVLPARQKIKN